MNRSLLIVALVALGACRHPSAPADGALPPPVTAAPTAVAPPQHLVAATTTTAAPPLPASADPATRVQAVLPHWIELLERGDDATFLDEAVVPEELAKVLDGKSKAELVTTFREEKHKGVLKMFGAIRGVAPTKVREEHERTFVTYDLRGEKGVTFVVVGASVYIKN
jgi:hypothetical protein